jgi:hypothetical protein
VYKSTVEMHSTIFYPRLRIILGIIHVAEPRHHPA